MRSKHWFAASLIVVSIAASGTEPEPSYVLMQSDLAELKADFNTAVDQVRLVFIVGPT